MLRGGEGVGVEMVGEDVEGGDGVRRQVRRWEKMLRGKEKAQR